MSLIQEDFTINSLYQKFSVFRCDLFLKYLIIQCSSANLKLNLEAASCTDLRVVVEKDGTDVDEDEALTMMKDEVFMILQPGKCWTAESVSATGLFLKSDSPFLAWLFLRKPDVLLQPGCITRQYHPSFSYLRKDQISSLS